MSNKTDEETCKIYEHKYLQLVCYWFVDKLHFAADFVAIIINTAAIIECIGTTSKAPFRFANRFEKLDCFHHITSLTEETNLPMHFGFIRCILIILTSSFIVGQILYGFLNLTLQAALLAVCPCTGIQIIGLPLEIYICLVV